MLLLILTKFVFSDAKIIRMSKINKQPGPLFIVHHNIFISLKKRCNIVTPLQPKQAFHRPHTCGVGYTAGTSNDFFIGFEMTKIYKARHIIVSCTLKPY